jgi:hypothetical protein
MSGKAQHLPEQQFGCLASEWFCHSAQNQAIVAGAFVVTPSPEDTAVQVQRSNPRAQTAASWIISISLPRTPPCQGRHRFKQGPRRMSDESNRCALVYTNVTSLGNAVAQRVSTAGHT